MMGKTHCGFVILLGAPNVGKSTLVNRLVGKKISIVSPKVQTTRTCVRGVFVRGETQIVFLDVPGIFAPRRRLDRAMVAAAWSAAADGDVTLLLIDAERGLDKNTQSIIDALEKKNQKVILVINKIDLIKRDALLPLMAKLQHLSILTQIFPISAKDGENVDELTTYLLGQMPESPFMFPDGCTSDFPKRLFAAEVTREKVFMNLQQELPYSITVETTDWQESDEAIKIYQNIFVERASQRPIVVGKGGLMLKKIGTAARKELAASWHKKIHLFLEVKVQENWGDNPARYQDWGLDFNV